MKRFNDRILDMFYLSDRPMVAGAFTFSLASHFLLIYVLPDHIISPMSLPQTIDAEVVIETLQPDRPEIVKLEEPPNISVFEPKVPAPKKSEELPPDAEIRQGFALPVLAAEGYASPSDTYTVPEVPMENVSLVGGAMGSAPAENTGSVYGSPSGNVIGSTSNPLAPHYLWEVYGREIQQQAARFGKYPDMARRLGQQGTVEVMFQIGADGKLKKLSVSQSSSFPSLDKQALDMVRKSLEALPIPDILIGRNFGIVIPVEFTLQ